MMICLALHCAVRTIGHCAGRRGRAGMWATAPYGYKVVGFPKRRAIEFRTGGSRARKALVKGSLETRREGGGL